MSQPITPETLVPETLVPETLVPETLVPDAQSSGAAGVAPADLASERARLAERAQPGDYVALLKPRVMSLVVFTGLVGLVAAPVPVSWPLGAVIILALALGAGSAGALNMWYDSDIDAAMQRTRARPIPAGRVPRGEALGLGLTGAFLSVMLMSLAAKNTLAAGLLIFSIWFYAVVYTMWLKRSTPQNIVIGGLAGAMPPAIAWAGASGDLTLGPILLVAIIFFWTPPHFWALSLYARDDYAAAGVPMLPNVAGAAHTRLSILLYSVVLVPLAITPALIGLGGWLYLAVSAGLGVLFLVLAVRLFASRAGDVDVGMTTGDLYAAKSGAKAARDLFAFSIAYLFCLFAALLVEHGLDQFHPLPWKVFSP